MVHMTKKDPIKCADPAVAKLESYWTVQISSTYWVVMESRGGDWNPVEHIPMPHHHATRLELTNLTEFGPRIAGASRVRFTLEITARDIQQDPGQRQWFTTYQARIIDACSVAAP